MKKLWILIVLIPVIMMSCAGSSDKKSGGFSQVTTPASELEQIKTSLSEKGVLAEIGIGLSNDEMVAMTIAQDEGRKQIAVSLGTQVKRLSDQYVQNVSNEAKKIWEEKTNQVTVELLRGTTPMKSVTLFNEESGEYKIYTLMVMDPTKFKAALDQIASANEELELRVKSTDMQARLDEAVKAYQEQYGR